MRYPIHLIYLMRLLIPGLVSGFILSSNAQTEPLTKVLNEIEDEQNELTEWIAKLQANPIDINNDSDDRLREIPFLTETHIDSILKYRPFTRRSQIRLLLGKEVYAYIRTLIVLKKTIRYPQISATQRFRYSLNQVKGISEKIYLGSAYESLSRIRIQANKSISAGILIQKDPGELSFYDHYSGFVAWQTPTFPVKITLGNYSIHCGEGLLLSGPYGLPKAALVIQPRIHRSLSLKPYLSSNEYDGFFGAAIRYGSDKGFKISAFYSHFRRDAIQQDSLAFILRMDRTGYHRTFSELAKCNKVLESSLGAVLHFPFLIFSQFGLAYVKTSYKPSFLVVQPENRRRDFFQFQGSLVENYAVFYTSQMGNLLVHGEISPRGMFRLTQKHSLSLLLDRWVLTFKWSHFTSGFQSPFGRSFADSNPFPNALQQFYFGSSGELCESLRLTGFWYSEKELWRSYFMSLPQIKKTIYFQSEYCPDPDIRVLFRYQKTSADENGENYASFIRRTSNRFRLQIEKKISTQVRICSRFEQNTVNYSNIFPRKSGINFYQNMSLNFNNYLRIKVQFSSFNTLDYDSRVYEYESDLPGVFSNFPLYGSGNKWYLLVSGRPVRGMKIWLKYRQISFDGVDYLGSGLSRIEGNTRQDIHFQIEYRY